MCRGGWAFPCISERDTRISVCKKFTFLTGFAGDLLAAEGFLADTFLTGFAGDLLAAEGFLADTSLTGFAGDLLAVGGLLGRHLLDGLRR